MIFQNNLLSSAINLARYEPVEYVMVGDFCIFGVTLWNFLNTLINVLVLMGQGDQFTCDWRGRYFVWAGAVRFVMTLVFFGSMTVHCDWRALIQTIFTFNKLTMQTIAFSLTVSLVYIHGGCRDFDFDKYMQLGGGLTAIWCLYTGARILSTYGRARPVYLYKIIVSFGVMFFNCTMFVQFWVHPNIGALSVMYYIAALGLYADIWGVASKRLNQLAREAKDKTIERIVSVNLSALSSTGNILHGEMNL